MFYEKRDSWAVGFIKRGKSEE